MHVLAGEVLPYAPARTALTPTATALYPPIRSHCGPAAAPLPYGPMRDPWVVARLLAGGTAVTGAGFALSFVLAALAAATTASGFVARDHRPGLLMSSGKAVITALGSSVH